MLTTLKRRLQILSVMRIRKYDKIYNLADYFEVNECTIRRDVKALNDYGVYAVSGRYGGGVYFDETFARKRSGMSDKQENLCLSLLPRMNKEEAEIMLTIIMDFAVQKNF